MRQLTPAEIGKTGLRAVVCGQVTNKWSLNDKETGEVIQGAKLAWMGGSGSVRFTDPREMDLFLEGDLIEAMVPLTESKGAYKLGKGQLMTVNGNKMGSKAS